MEDRISVRNRPGRWISGLLAAIGIALTAGCATMDCCQSCCFWAAPELPHGEVRQVAALWADGVVVQPDPFNNGNPTPGFSGRVYLFGPDMVEPLVADGILSIYLYDQMQPAGSRGIPLEVWNLDEANLKRLLKKDGLGWGYNIWVPWSTRKPEIQKVYMIVKYHPHQGIDAWSGTTAIAVNDGSNLRPPAELQMHSSRLGGNTSADAQRVRTTTLAVPSSSSLSKLAPAPNP